MASHQKLLWYYSEDLVYLSFLGLFVWGFFYFLFLAHDHPGLVSVIMVIYITGRNEFKCFVRLFELWFPSVAQPAVCVYLMLWLQTNTVLSYPAGGNINVSLLSPAPTLAVSSVYVSFSCYWRTAFSHFVMQHTVCVFNVKWLNENIVLQRLGCFCGTDEQDKPVCVSPVNSKDT